MNETRQSLVYSNNIMNAIVDVVDGDVNGIKVKNLHQRQKTITSFFKAKEKPQRRGRGRPKRNVTLQPLIIPVAPHSLLETSLEENKKKHCGSSKGIKSSREEES